MSKILTCIPVKPGMNPGLMAKCLSLAGSMPSFNPVHSMATYYDHTPIARELSDHTPWSRVCRARNMILDRIKLDQWDYLLWVDADVVDYPMDMPTRLIAGNPGGVSAPMVLIEGRKEFYDWAAFVMKGKDTVKPTNRHRVWGRNLQHEVPYWNECDAHTEDDPPSLAKPFWYQPKETVVEMDCVGTITMVPSILYQHGARYEDHPAFTDHHPICKYARSQNLKVTVDRSIIAHHADLPKWGEAWH